LWKTIHQAVGGGEGPGKRTTKPSDFGGFWKKNLEKKKQRKNLVTLMGKEISTGGVQKGEIKKKDLEGGKRHPDQTAPNRTSKKITESVPS